VPKTYDPGDESGSIPTLADAATTATPVGGIAYLSGATPTLVSLANGLPVQPGTGTTWAVTGTFWQATQPVSLVTIPLATDAATATLQGTGNTSLASIDGKLPNLVTGRVPVDGSGVTQPVSIAGTVAVSGPLTDAQLRATAVPVSLTSTTITGTVAATQSGTWTVTGAGGTFPVTDSGGSLTVDAPVGTPVFVRLSDGASAISTLPVSLASVPSHDVTNAGTFAVQVTSMPTTTVSGTVAATQSGTWNITNISGTVSLPTGAATAAKQPALGTAGTASADVLTVQGIASMTALKVDGSAVTQPVSGTFWQATQPVSIASTVTVTGTGGTFPVTDSGGSLTVDNAGTFAVQVDGAALTSLQLLDDVVFAEDAAHTTGDKGVQVLTVRRDTAASTAGTDGDYASFTTDSTGRLWCNVSNTVTVDTELPAAVALGGNANPTTPLIGACLLAQEGSTWEVLSGENGYLNVNAVISSSSVTFSNNADKTEDAAHSTGAIGTFVLAVRSDTAASTAGTDGDYTALTTDSTGRLWCNVSNTVTVSGTVTANAGTNLNTSALALESGGNLAGAATSLAAIDDWDESDRAKVNLVVGQAGVAAGAGSVSANTIRVVHAIDDIPNVNIANVADNTIAINTGTVTDGCIRVTLATDVALPTGANTIGSIATVGGVTVAANGTVTGAGTSAPAISLVGNTGSAFVPWSMTSGGAGFVLVDGGNIDCTQTGTWNIGTVTTCSTVTMLTGGGVAHDSADSGNPVKVGARAAATLSDDTMVANGDRTDAVSDLDGALLVRSGFPLGDLISERITNTDGSSTAFTNFGATASTRNYVTAISLFNSSATAGYVDFRDGTAGSVLFTVAIPAGGGAVIANGGVPLFGTTANTALAFDVSAALSTVYISISGYKSKV